MSQLDSSLQNDSPVGAPSPQDAHRSPNDQSANGQGNPLLEVNNLRKYFAIKRGFFSRVVGHVKAVDGVSFYVRAGETLGLVGESGCGKTTTGRTVLRAIDPTSGEIWFSDQNMGRVNVAELDNHQLKRLRRNMQMVFQDPLFLLESAHDVAAKRGRAADRQQGGFRQRT